MIVHERSNEVFLKLAEQGVITIYDNIDAEMVSHIRDRLAIARANKMNELEIDIQTNGGNVVAGLDIYDMIRAAPVKRRRGLVLGYAHSMGVIILQACDVREATRNARLLLHEVLIDERISLSVLRDQRKLKKAIEGGGELQRDLETILIKRTKRSAAEVRRICAKDTEMTAQEALDFGLIDAIRE